jgi:CDP-diacylglycerol--glycerol-3-phosphate 3-phosphatidyltransferase
MVARLTHQSSDAGEVLDAAVDRYAEFFFLGGLVLYYRETPVLQFLSLLTLLGCFMVSYSTAKAEALRIDPPKSSMRRPERAFYLTLGAMLSPVSISMFESFTLGEKPWGYPMVIAMGLVGIVSNFSAAERFVVLARLIREQEKKIRKSSSPECSSDSSEQGHSQALQTR